MSGAGPSGQETGTYESYPARMVAVSVVVTLSTYALGALVLSGLGSAAAAAYLAYCAAYELWVMRHSCVNCWYYGKVCGLGRGKISAYLFPKGDPGAFSGLTVTWRTLVPDLLILLLPLAGGLVIVVLRFSWRPVAGMVMLAALSLGGNAYVRTRIACRYCRQREIGCPAERFFGGAKAP